MQVACRREGGRAAFVASGLRERGRACGTGRTQHVHQPACKAASPMPEGCCTTCAAQHGPKEGAPNMCSSRGRDSLVLHLCPRAAWPPRTFAPMRTKMASTGDSERLSAGTQPPTCTHTGTRASAHSARSVRPMHSLAGLACVRPGRRQPLLCTQIRACTLTQGWGDHMTSSRRTIIGAGASAHTHAYAYMYTCTPARTLARARTYIHTHEQHTQRGCPPWFAKASHMHARALHQGIWRSEHPCGLSGACPATLIEPVSESFKSGGPQSLSGLLLPPPKPLEHMLQVRHSHAASGAPAWPPLMSLVCCTCPTLFTHPMPRGCHMQPLSAAKPHRPTAAAYPSTPPSPPPLPRQAQRHAGTLWARAHLGQQRREAHLAQQRALAPCAHQAAQHVRRSTSGTSHIRQRSTRQATLSLLATRVPYGCDPAL